MIRQVSLDAPAEMLKYLSVHVIGTACENFEDEVLLLKDKHGQPHCLIAAVPILETVMCALAYRVNRH